MPTKAAMYKAARTIAETFPLVQWAPQEWQTFPLEFNPPANAFVNGLNAFLAPQTGQS